MVTRSSTANTRHTKGSSIFTRRDVEDSTFATATSAGTGSVGRFGDCINGLLAPETRLEKKILSESNLPTSRDGINVLTTRPRCSPRRSKLQK